MSPWHIRGIGGKSAPAISCISAQKIDPRHLATKTIIENVAHGALRETSHRVGAQCGIALARSRRIDDQGLIQCGISLEPGAARSVLVGQSDVRIRITQNQIVQQRRRYRVRRSTTRLVPGPKNRFCTVGNVSRTMPHCGVSTDVSQAS